MATRLYHRSAFLHPQVCDTKFHAPPQQRHGVVSQARPGLRDYDMVTVINSTRRYQDAANVHSQTCRNKILLYQSKIWPLIEKNTAPSEWCLVN